MKKTLLFISAVLFCNLSFAAQSYYFYNSQGLAVMNPYYSYMAVKFDENVTSPVKESILNSVFGNSLESKSEMIVGSQSGKKYSTYICKLKSDVNKSAADGFKASLLKNKNIVFAEIGFKAGGKVVHLVTNEIIVKFKKNVSEFDINNLDKLYNTDIIEHVNGFDNIYLLKISSDGSDNTDNAFDVSNRYALTQFVDFAQPNFIRLGMLCSPPNDSLLPDMWNIQNTGHNNPFNIQTTPGCDLNVIPAWEQTHGNPRVLMGIIDTGVDTNHIDLKGNLCDDRSLWYDAYDEDHTPFDEFSHGTAITGIAAAMGNNHIGTIGVAFGCKVMPIRAFGPWPDAATTDLILAKALNWAWIHGSSVLSNSWGGGIPTPIIDHAILNAVHYGRNGKGAVVFAASGNDDTNVVLYPSSMPQVICVGGLSPCNERKSKVSCDNFNNEQDWGASYGENLSVVAPTPFIGTTLVLGGWCICANGTSSSCPQAAAIGALILSKNNNLPGDSVKIIIERSAQKVGNYSYSVQKPNGLWNNEMGYGRIDAKFALDMTPPGPSYDYDQVPPVINAQVPPSGRTNSAFSIIANIHDNVFVANGSNSPRMYYRISDFPEMHVTQGVKSSDDNYSFQVPLLPYGRKMYFYFAAQDTSSNGNFATYPYGGKGINPPGTTAPQRFLFWQNSNVKDTLLASTNVPIQISGNAETTVVSLINSNLYKTLLGVTCLINIHHTYLAELNVSLISPAGTDIVLASGVGNDSDNFVNTNFDDYALTRIDDTANHAPFTGTFKPVEKLWLLNGEDANGTWKLKVVDNGSGDGGVLNSWSIVLKYSSDYDKSVIPTRFGLLNNYPNPFNPTTRIMFSVPYRARVKIIISDILGRQVVKLLDDFRNPALEDYVDFNTSDSRINGGSGLASGIYFYSLIVDDNFIESKKMVLLK